MSFETHPGGGLTAHPDEVRIDVDGRSVAVSAEQLHRSERADAWQQITASARRFARFQQQTDRELPIIRLRLLRTGDPAADVEPRVRRSPSGR